MHVSPTGGFSVSWAMARPMCQLAGGHIRNVVLSAAVLAKQANEPITMDDIVIALAGEYRKLGKQMPPDFKRVIQPN